MRVAFLLLWSRKELWHFKVKESIHFVEQKYYLYQKRKGIENGKSHTVLERRNLCLSLKKNCKLKVKVRWVGVRERKKGIFCTVYFVQRQFFKICVLSQCTVYWIHFQNIHTFTFQKVLLHRFLLLKKTKAFNVSLSHFNLIWSFSANRWNYTPFFLRFEVFLSFFVLSCIIVSFWSNL